MILVTGGAGFIGSNFIVDWLDAVGEPVVNYDALTYAGHLRNLKEVLPDARHSFERGSINDAQRLSEVLAHYRPTRIVHFAAETHVDRSIAGPERFFETNVMGTVTLLGCVQRYWEAMDAKGRAAFRLLHVSTDEVYGSLEAHEAPFTEASAYRPSSPYAASKAASDHAVRSWHRTYGLPVITTHCSNNYGPRQFPEKLIPLMISRALACRAMPVYGDGRNVRDWLHVHDHNRALRAILAHGRIADNYNVGAGNERSNIEIVTALCAILDRLRPSSEGPYAQCIEYVTDRLGHDRRYAVNADKLRDELGWEPIVDFEQGLTQTVRWYLEHPDWLKAGD